MIRTENMNEKYMLAYEKQFEYATTIQQFKIILPDYILILSSLEETLDFDYKAILETKIPNLNTFLEANIAAKKMKNEIKPRAKFFWQISYKHKPNHYLTYVWDTKKFNAISLNEICFEIEKIFHSKELELNYLVALKLCILYDASRIKKNKQI